MKVGLFNMSNYKHIELWNPALNYMGDDFTKYYYIYGTARQVSGQRIQTHNFDEIIDILKLSEDNIVNFGGFPCPSQNLFIHKDDTELLKQAEELLSQLSDYPLLNDDRYYQELSEDTMEYIAEYPDEFKGMNDEEAYELAQTYCEEG